MPFTRHTKDLKNIIRNFPAQRLHKRDSVGKTPANSLVSLGKVLSRIRLPLSSMQVIRLSSLSVPVAESE